MRRVIQTPANLTITPRDRAFGRGQRLARFWYGGDPGPTALYSLLSLTFPKGEAFFIDSVRQFRDAVDPVLAEQIDAFTRQEATHSREHARLNRQIGRAGYDLTQFERGFSACCEAVKQRPALINLAATVALEHFTAILAHAWLANRRYFEGAPPQVARLWRWHAMEEIEHKAVAFDTFLAVTRHLSPFRRWTLRSGMMLAITSRLLGARTRDLSILFAQDGVDNRRAWRGLAIYLIFSPGLLREIFLPWLAFFRPSFHPWEHDDRSLVDRGDLALDEVAT